MAVIKPRMISTVFFISLTVLEGPTHLAKADSINRNWLVTNQNITIFYADKIDRNIDVNNVIPKGEIDDFNNESEEENLKMSYLVGDATNISDIFTTRFVSDTTSLSPDNGECVLAVSNKSINKFRHIAYYAEANFVYLNLVPGPGVNITMNESNHVVGDTLWVWTFWGKEGGLEFLKWPIEFGIWSIGLLNSYVITQPIVINLQKQRGNCTDLQVGTIRSDMIISTALTSLALDMMRFDSEKYGPSFFCYKKRKIIQPHFVYMLCKHIVCPLEALKYTCCNFYFNETTQNRTIGCRENREEFEYEPVSWIMPTIVSFILFAYFPLCFLFVAHLIADKNNIHKSQSLRDITTIVNENETIMREKMVLLNEHHQVTLFKTIISPVKSVCFSFYSNASRSCQSVYVRVWRLVIPFLSLFIIGLQICLDYYFLHNFVVTSVQAGVPLGFRSLLAGYDASRQIFLPYLGGPFVAVGMYLFVMCILLVFPKSVSGLLLCGLQSNMVDESYSPLCLTLRSIEKFGSVRIRHRHGYLKLQSVMTAQFLMLINTNFWKNTLSVQAQRWRNGCRQKCCIFLAPLYILICILEIALCLAFYGLPIISFAFIMVKAYYRKLRSGRVNSVPLKLVLFLITIILITFVLFFLFMFGIIFMDAFLFISRVGMFTFTGIVVYPKMSYGYIIFALTTIYYLWQSIQDFSKAYDNLLKDTIHICEGLQRANDTEKLVTRVGDFKGIKESLFEHVIENHCPRRKQVFISALKVAVILTILGIFLGILTETDGFRELHVVMHVGTAVFICALPQIMKSMCHGTGEKYRHRLLRREIKETINNFIGYQHEEELSSDSDQSEAGQ